MDASSYNSPASSPDLPSHVSNCTHCNQTVADASWTSTRDSILQYILPCVCVCGTILGCVSLTLSYRQTSYEIYLYFIQFSHILILLSSLILQLDQFSPTYLYHLSFILARCYSPMSMIHSWSHYSSVWLLVTLVLDRTSTLTNNRVQTVCTRTQAVIISTLIITASLFSALPQLWQYDVVEVFDYTLNTSVSLVELTHTATSPQYEILYFWYTTALVMMSFPVIVISALLLCRRMRKEDTKLRRHNNKHIMDKRYHSNIQNKRFHNNSSLQRRYAAELKVTRLCMITSLLYLVLTGPIITLKTCERIVNTQNYETVDETIADKINSNALNEKMINDIRNITINSTGDIDIGDIDNYIDLSYPINLSGSDKNNIDILDVFYSSSELCFYFYFCLFFILLFSYRNVDFCTKHNEKHVS